MIAGNGYSQNLLNVNLFILLMLASSAAISQDSIWVWRDKATKSIKFFAMIGYQVGKGEKGFGIPIGIGYQRICGNGRFRINASVQDATFRSIAITDSPDHFFRVSTMGFYSDIDILRYHSFSVVLGTGAGLSYSRGYTSIWWDEDTSQSIYGGYFNRWYLSGYLAYGIRIAPKRGRYAIEIFFPPGGHANKNFVILNALKVGVDYRF